MRILPPVLIVTLMALVLGCMEEERDISPAEQAVREWEAMSAPRSEKPPANPTGNVSIVVSKITFAEGEQSNIPCVAVRQ